MTVDLGFMKQFKDHVDSKTNGQSATRNDYLDKYVQLPKKNGYTVLRILPPAAGRKIPFSMTRLHVLERDGRKRNIHCSREFVNGKWVGKCLLCSYYSDLWQQSEKEMNPDKAEFLRRQARAIKPIDRFYFNAVQRSRIGADGTVEKNAAPLILAVGKTLFEKIMEAYFGNDTKGKKPIGDISDLKNGRDFRVVVEMTGSGREVYPKYDDSTFEEETSPAGTPEEIDTWMNNLNDLDALRMVKPADEMKRQLRIYLGQEQDSYGNADFDLNEFKKSTGQAVVEKVTPVAEVPKEVVVQETTTTNDLDISIPDDEFYNDLNNL